MLDDSLFGDNVIVTSTLEGGCDVAWFKPGVLCAGCYTSHKSKGSNPRCGCCIDHHSTGSNLEALCTTDIQVSSSACHVINVCRCAHACASCEVCVPWSF